MAMQSVRSSTGSLNWGIRCDRCKRWFFAPVRSAAAVAIRNARTSGWIVDDHDLCPHCVGHLSRPA